MRSRVDRHGAAVDEPGSPVDVDGALWMSGGRRRRQLEGLRAFEECRGEALRDASSALLRRHASSRTGLQRPRVRRAESSSFARRLIVDVGDPAMRRGGDQAPRSGSGWRPCPATREATPSSGREDPRRPPSRPRPLLLRTGPRAGGSAADPGSWRSIDIPVTRSTADESVVLETGTEILQACRTDAPTRTKGASRRWNDFTTSADRLVRIACGYRCPDDAVVGKVRNRRLVPQHPLTRSTRAPDDHRPRCDQCPTSAASISSVCSSTRHS